VAADHVQGAANALLAKRLGVSRLYILYDYPPYGRGIADSVRRGARKLGIEVARFESWNPGARSYAALGRRIRSAAVDGVFLGGYITSNGGQLLNDLRAALGPSVPILAPDGFLPLTVFLERAGPEAEGLTVSSPLLPSSHLPEAGVRFVSAFEEAVGRPAQPPSVAAAQATEVMLDAIARSDGTRASVVRELFKTRVEDGILGTFSFDRNGDTTAGAVTIFRVEKGKQRVFAVITPPARLVR
jgi:branched-chain amino acid transport system substrate-binding protein